MTALRLLDKLGETAEMIKFQHTVFALPFAVIALLAARPFEWPSAWVWVLILAAMVSARSAAMSFNRLVDAEIDAVNPRTQNRSIPAGRLSRAWVGAFTGVSSLVFILSAFLLNPACGYLSIPVLLFLLGYSLTKRWTALSHVWLGTALGLAPPAAWLAAGGRPAMAPVILGGAVMFWVAGFDIIYSLQDEAFDRDRGLFSIPASLGARRALMIARIFHGTALAGFLIFAHISGGGFLRISAAASAGILLAWQHHLVSPGDLSRVDAAFFTVNGVLSVVMGLLFLLAHAQGVATGSGPG